MTNIITRLIQDARHAGVQITGLTPTSIPNGGIGLVASRNLEEGEVIINIPIEAIRSLHTILGDVRRKLPKDMSIHGLLAAEIALGRAASADWMSLVPTWEDFETTVPYLWDEQLQRLLPAEAKGILATQQTKFEKDWAMFTKGFPEKSRRDFLYAWLLVNSRTFYYETNDMLRYPWDDRLAMLPVADLFNHAETGCAVAFTTEGYTVTADRRYRAGDEVHTSYGEHTNDFLMAEYGFILEQNRWDKLCLDNVILPCLNLEQRTMLKENGHLGDFMFSPSCSDMDESVWIGLRILCRKDADADAEAEGDWSNYVNGEEDEQGTLSKAVEMMPDILEEYLGYVVKMQDELRGLQVGKSGQRELLQRRWAQIEAMVRQALQTPVSV